MMKSRRVAATTRLKTSRPSWSVPNQCSIDGGLSVAVAALASGSYGTIQGPIKAAIRISTNRPKASPVTGFSAMT